MSSEGIITKDTTIADAMRLCPGAPDIFREFGMGCCACMAASAETIEQGAEMHDADAQAIVDRLNAECGKDNK
jgi:hybrid cluster-associated redox disulfide protein